MYKVNYIEYPHINWYISSFYFCSFRKGYCNFWTWYFQTKFQVWRSILSERWNVFKITILDQFPLIKTPMILRFNIFRGSTVAQEKKAQERHPCPTRVHFLIFYLRNKNWFIDRQESTSVLLLFCFFFLTFTVAKLLISNMHFGLYLWII